MDNFLRDLCNRAATFDELLGPEFQALPGSKSTADQAAKRLAAWCRSCANGDWLQFSHRLQTQGWRFEDVISRFAAVKRADAAEPPLWFMDANWVDAAMRAACSDTELRTAYPFAEFFVPVVDEASKLAWRDLHFRQAKLSRGANDALQTLLLVDLTELCSAALYERFEAFRSAAKHVPPGLQSRSIYAEFVHHMRSVGLRELFQKKPVLLRLIAVLVRQWVETTREFLLRLDADALAVSKTLLGLADLPIITGIESSRSDRHNDGRTVLLLEFENHARVVYKPKDLSVDRAWKEAIDQLNERHPPVDLKAAKVLNCDGYGWTEFIEHTGCKNDSDVDTFFRRAGAWLALLHRFVAADMHQENIIASGAHPVPIDLETVFHTRGDEAEDLEEGARGLVRHRLAESVMMVGLLPAYGRSPFNNVFAVGGLTSGWTKRTKIEWDNVNSDGMRPRRIEEDPEINPNLPHIDGRYAKFKDNIDPFIEGFRQYAEFLTPEFADWLVPKFAGLPVRTVLRPTRFYYMLQQRLRDHKTMDDGVIWSAQADFLGRLPHPSWDPDRRLQKSEREALLSLNIPHFTTPTDLSEIKDQSGLRIPTGAESGMARARARFGSYDAREIQWQSEIISENTRPPTAKTQTLEAAVAIEEPPASLRQRALEEANWVAEELSRCAFRKDSEAAWIGREWFEDAEAFQLACLGPDLYNGASGISVFLAAHSKSTGCVASRELALAAVARLRDDLRTQYGAQLARTMGIGGAVGFGSIAYALAVIGDLVQDEAVRSDALRAARLITPELIGADTRLDVIGGSAGAILCLLRVFRDTGAGDVLERAVGCGNHLLNRPRLGPAGQRSWLCGPGSQPLNGMSHGAAGFAYALAALYEVTRDQKFAEAATEALAYENAGYDPGRKNWPDFRLRTTSQWTVRWCHGAGGIGLARAAMTKLRGQEQNWFSDIGHAAECVEVNWASDVDTLCCGSLGNIELLRAAGNVLSRKDLRENAAKALRSVISSRRAMGDYRWNGGATKFNLGLFRGLSGVGYTCLREIDPNLPNVLIWE